MDVQSHPARRSSAVRGVLAALISSRAVVEMALEISMKSSSGMIGVATSGWSSTTLRLSEGMRAVYSYVAVGSREGCDWGTIWDPCMHTMSALSLARMPKLPCKVNTPDRVSCTVCEFVRFVEHCAVLRTPCLHTAFCNTFFRAAVSAAASGGHCAGPCGAV
jgi:hypothetical protein